MDLIKQQVAIDTARFDDKTRELYENLAQDASENPNKLWDLDDNTYRSAPGVSQSDLKEFMTSGMKYHHKKIMGNSTASTKSMEFGTLIHEGTLEPEKIDEQYFNDDVLIEQVMEEKPDTKSPRSTKIYKEMKAQVEEKGLQILKHQDYSAMKEMVNRLYTHPRAKNILSGGHSEKVLIARDPKTGLLLKGKPDFLRMDGFVADLKTCQDASKKEFSKTLFNTKYYIQAAFYLKLANICFGEHFKDFIFINIESSAPYEIGIYKPDNAAIDAGMQMVDKYLEKLSIAYNMNKWPSYGDNIQAVALPHWAYNQLDEELENEL